MLKRLKVELSESQHTIVNLLDGIFFDLLSIYAQPVENIPFRIRTSLMQFEGILFFKEKKVQKQSLNTILIDLIIEYLPTS